MKPLLLLLALLTSAPQPPAVRVTFSPLTKAAYLAAQKGCLVTKPKMTFPLKKVRGRIVIPTTKGNVVFADNLVEEGSPEWEEYKYLGYIPNLDCHLLEHSHYEWLSNILVDKNGRQTEVYNSLVYSTNFKSFATISAGIEDAVFPNEIRIFQFNNHRWRQVWKLEPSVEPVTWEPDAICWTSPTTLLLRKKMWTGSNPGTTYTYARLTIH